MKTYFIRHTDAMDVDLPTFERLLNEPIVAVHFPDWEDGKGPKGSDCTSLNPEDYSTKGRHAMNLLKEIAINGGYVCAEYSKYGRHLVRIGKVSPDAKMELLTGKWGTRWGQQGRDAVLKTLKLEVSKIISTNENPTLLADRPRQGTIRRWPAAKDRVAGIVEGRNIEFEWHSLPSAKQEVVCAEFLRFGQIDGFEFPKLKYLLLPVGRTLKDLDVYGLADDGKKIFGQVTNYPIEGEPAKAKLARLLPYTDGYRVLFCEAPSPRIENGAIVIPVSLVFAFFMQTTLGEKLLRLF